MLALKNRLRKKVEFENVYKNGDFFSAGNLSLKCAKSEASFFRIGFVVGVKFSPKAIVRNKIKRQLREIFSQQTRLLKKKMDIVIMIKKQEKVTFAGLQKDAEKLLKKAKLID
jgi:ribonuclease P protein component